jgi:hypothetical protein
MEGPEYRDLCILRRCVLIVYVRRACKNLTIRDWFLKEKKVICPKCGKEFDPSPRATELCPTCFMSSERSDQRDTFGDASSSHPEFHFGGSFGYCPWEDEAGIGFIQGLLQTLRQSIFQPTNFFKHLPLQGGYKFPFLYALVVSSISILATYITSTIWESSAMSMSHGMIFLGPRLGAIIYVLLVVVLEIFIKPAVLLVCLLALGVRNAKMESVFRISCYSTGPGIFNIVPLFGSLVAGVWEFVILVIGLKEGFGIGTDRAIIAILLPLIITVVFLIVAIMMVIGKLF